MKSEQIIDIVSLLPVWGTNGPRTLNAITELIVHHSATIFNDGDDAIGTFKAIAYDQSQGSRYEKISGNAKVHPDGIQYHFGIANGNIYKLAELTDIKWHAGDFPTNLKSVAVVVLGDFQTQTISDIDRKALLNLIWMLSKEDHNDFQDLVNIDTANGGLKAHCDIVADACPGNNLIPIVHDLINTHLQSGKDWISSLTPIQAVAPISNPVTEAVSTPNTSGITSQEQINQLNAKINELTNSISSFQNENISLTSQVNNLTSSLTQVATERDTALKDNASLEDQVNQLKTQLDSEMKAYTGAVNEEDSLSEEVKSLKGQISQLQNSNNDNAPILSGLKELLSRYGITV